VRAFVAVGGWFAQLEQTVRQADPQALGFVIALLGVAAAAGGWFAWRSLYRIRLIQDTPTARTRSAHQGYVELEGVARMMDDAPITARLSGLPCCWYRYRVEELEHSRDARGHSRMHWRVVERGTSDDTFWLEDDTGRVAVDPAGAEIQARYKDNWRSRSGLAGIARPTPYFIDFFNTHGVTRTYRFTEERINRGDPVYVLGMLRNLGSHDNLPTIDTRIRELLREWKQNQGRLRERFDLDQNGKIDEREWLLARQAARREAERAQAEATNQSVEGINLVSDPRDDRRPYLISAFTQAELLAQRRRGFWISAVLFFVAGVVATWLYQLRFAGG